MSIGSKLTITGRPFYGACTIELDGHPLQNVTAIELRMESGLPPEAILSIALDEVEVDSAFMLYLRGHLIGESDATTAEE